jgi:hypothetical protein
MRRLLLMLAAAASFAGPGLAGEPAEARAGDVVFAADFEGTDALKAVAARAGAVTLDRGFRSDGALRLDVPGDAAARTAHIQVPLPVEKVRGAKLVLSARVKAEGVSAKPQSWNGIKFMVPMAADGAKTWPQAEIGVGTFDWRPVTWQLYVPDTATEMVLVLGLEQVTGRVWFDDVKIAVRRPRAAAAPGPAPGPVYKGHGLPRLRGAMVSNDIDAESLRVLGKEWNANLIRWQLIGWLGSGQGVDLAKFDEVLETHLKKLDAALPLCEKYGLMVVVDLHAPPGGSHDSNLFNDPACQRKFVEAWEKMARRYKDARAVWGYDLLNEPVEGTYAEGCADWQDLAERAAQAIRAIDPARAIICEPAQGGGPAGLRELRPLGVPNVVYSVHMYLPHVFTHQGVFESTKKPYAYPGEIEGVRWDKARLEAALKPAADFQKAYNVHIYIGEFSAIRWAPEGSAGRYIGDLIDIFEANGWDWTYHAFREWQGWSAEHGPDKADASPAKSPTDRQQLLRKWYAKNERPKDMAAVSPDAPAPGGTRRAGPQ